MEIIYPPTIIPFLKNKRLLLDTNLFRDAVARPTSYDNFFKELKKSNVIFTTIDSVKYELLKGASDNAKYKIKEELIYKIIDEVISCDQTVFELVYNLIQLYGEDGAALNITDLMLGAILMQYRENICLITRDTTDFIQDIFDLKFIVNSPHKKGIFTYGVYQYAK